MSAANAGSSITSGVTLGDVNVNRGGYNPQGIANELDADRLRRQIETAPPQYQAGDGDGQLTLSRPTNLEPTEDQLRAQGVNFDTLPPTRQTGPTARKEYLMAREALRRNIPSQQLGERYPVLHDTIKDEEVQELMDQKAMVDKQRYDAYVKSRYDFYQPGHLQKLYKIEPDLVHGALDQIDRDYNNAVKAHLIDTFGINSKDDMRFQYLRDQGAINVPRLVTEAADEKQYEAGALSFWATRNRPSKWSAENTLNLPFSSSRKTGRRQGSHMAVNLPFQANSNLNQLASHHWNGGGNATVPNRTRFGHVGNNAPGVMNASAVEAAGIDAMGGRFAM